MFKMLIIFTFITTNLFSYYNEINFKNEYGYNMNYGWLQKVNDEKYNIYLSSDENMGVGYKKIYVLFKNYKPKKVQLKLITEDDVKPMKTIKINKTDNEWLSYFKIPSNCEGKCKIKIEFDKIKNLKPIKLYLY